MPKKSLPLSGLTERDRLLLEQVDRYRLSTISALRKAVTPELSRNAATKIIQRLCVAGWLQKYPLRHPDCYFVLGQAGTRFFGRGRERVRPLGPQSLPIAYALLFYTVLARHARRRLTPTEVCTRCPWISPMLARAPHCSDSGSDVLELVRVDLGGPVHHVARKCAADVAIRIRIREFPGWVAAGHFRLVVITSAPEKGVALRQALDRHSWPTGLAIHLSVIPALLSVLPGKHHA